MIRRYLLTAALAALITVPAFAQQTPPTTPPPAEVKPEVKKDGPKLTRPVATLVTTKGTIKIELYPEDAPKTVQNFIDLIKRKFYDGIVFHRVVPGFVIQGGDPTGTGSGGSGTVVPNEANKILKHDVGAVGMANAGPDTATSQFYIVITNPAYALDAKLPDGRNKYTVFAKVIEGQDVAEKIAQGDKMTTVTIEEPVVDPSAAPVLPKITKKAEPSNLDMVIVPIFEKPQAPKTLSPKIKVTVEADGKFKTEIKESTGIKELDKAVLEALNRWKWSPALKEGKPVKSDVTFKYDITTGARSYE